MCIDVIDEENIYAAYYNRGISLRKVRDYAGSLTFFKKALRWARERGDQESECFIFGQLALTYSKSENLEKALDFYNKCKVVSGRLKNCKLELDCLVKALDLKENISVKTGKFSFAPSKDEYNTAFNVPLTLPLTSIGCSSDRG